MPRKTKDVESNEIDIVKPVTKAKKVSSNSSSKKTTSNKSPLKSEKKTTKSKATASKTTTKKTTKSKATSSKTTTAKTKRTNSKATVTEYYDLPYRYNETVVKILAQTPKKLFVYWDISDSDRQKYIDEFGPDFFNSTKPVLVVHNDSINYTFEVEINDFANCWYLDINDAKSNYTIELIRRPKVQNYYIPNSYVYVASSNIIESPNDHILFEQQSQTIYFRNVKNNNTYSKNIASLSFMRNMGKIYNIYDAYKKLYDKIYNDEDIIDINNPSSNNPTSTFK